MSFKWKRRGRFWAGTLVALASWWLCFAILFLLFDWSLNKSGLGLFFIASILLPLALIPAGGWAAGLICAVLWHPVADRVTCERWGALVVSLLFAPLLLLGWRDFFTVSGFVAIAFVCALVPFHRGINHGFRLWHEGYWRHFAGLANDYERDDRDGV